jgi:hypothetical protein
MVASAGRHFLWSMIVNPNQCRPSSLPIISDGPLLFDQAESVSFEQSDQFAEFQDCLLQSRPYRHSPTERRNQPAGFASAEVRVGLEFFPVFLGYSSLTEYPA